MTHQGLTIRRLAPELKDDFLRYLEGAAFADNPAWMLLDAFADEPIPDAAHVGQITCFVVAREHRRTGVARALLAEACTLLRDQGLRVAEAHPSRQASTDAQNHFGPLSLYLSSGFSVVKEQDDGLVVVRRPLV